MGISHFLRRHTGSRSEVVPSPASTGPLTWTAALGDQVEAYVTGHLADLYARAGWSVPPWVLLNRLAHCSIEELADFVAAGRSFRRHRGPRPWFVAELALAERLITLGRTPNGLRRIQLDILIPVELALAASAKIGRLTPGQVVGATTAALDAYAV